MNNKLGNSIRRRRNQLGLSQSELSRLSGVDRTTISKIENGERKTPLITTLNKIFKILDMDIYDVMKVKKRFSDNKPEKCFLCKNCMKKENMYDSIDEDAADGKYIKFEIKFNGRYFVEGNDDCEVNLSAAQDFDNAIINICEYPEYFLDLIDECSVDVSWGIDNE